MVAEVREVVVPPDKGPGEKVGQLYELLRVSTLFHGGNRQQSAACKGPMKSRGQSTLASLTSQETQSIASRHQK